MKLKVRAFLSDEPGVELDIDAVHFADVQERAQLAFVSIYNDTTCISLDPDANDEIVIYIGNSNTAWISNRNHVPYTLREEGKLKQTIILNSHNQEIK